jgi:Family of unknown function (DUF6338)
MDVFSTSKLVIIIALLVPGFISMKAYGAFHPVERITLKDNVLEAIAFGLVNFALLFWPITLIAKPEFVALHSFATYVLVVLIFLIAPIVWAMLLLLVFQLLERKNIILRRHKTAWDDFFARRQPCWIIVHLKDGRRIGGRYAEKSYASLYPNSGHLYLEELWKLDDAGRFAEEVPGTQGLILRPCDYAFIELFQASGDTR